MAKAQTTRVNRKHFVLYNNGGVISATTPKDWARAHQDLFPTYNFADSDNTPSSEDIEKYLTIECGFGRLENTEVVICYAYKNL